MKDADKTVQKLLISLRDAQPAAAMEQRILIAIEHAAEARLAPKASPQWPWGPGWWRQAPAASVACAAVLTFGLVLIVTGRPHARRLTNVSSHPAGPDTRQTRKPFDGPRTPSGHFVGPASVAPVKRESIRARSHHAAADEASASTGYPAPPLPLTQQEKLLLRLAHRVDPGSLSILNPEARGAQMARTTQQFQRFFGMSDHEMRIQVE